MNPMKTSSRVASDAIVGANRCAPCMRERRQHVVDVVPAELLAVGGGHDERDHRLADHAAAGTTVESVRSRIAWAGSLVSVSTERSGLVIVEMA
jgi:hypothetical protein